MIQYLYIAKAKGFDDVYKVGRSADPVSRMVSLKADYDCEFELKFKQPMNNPDSESAAHIMLSKYKSDVFGASRREVFSCEYMDLLNIVMYSNIANEDRDDEDLDYVVSWLPSVLEEKGVDQCVHNGKYHVRPVGDETVLISRTGSEGVDWSRFKTGWSNGSVSIQWVNDDEVEIS
ncbi:unnamed protein product, partial [marine sediment metagenome]